MCRCFCNKIRNSTRSPSPLFFHRETQETRDRLHWCIDHWFSDASILWLCLNIATTTTGHMQRALNPCASQNLKRKRKRGLSELKIAVFVRKQEKWLVVYCCDGRYSLGGERSQHKIFTAWFSTPYFALRTISVRYLCRYLRLNRCPHRSQRSLNPIHWQILLHQTNDHRNMSRLSATDLPSFHTSTLSAIFPICNWYFVF